MNNHENPILQRLQTAANKVIHCTNYSDTNPHQISHDDLVEFRNAYYIFEQ